MTARAGERPLAAAVRPAAPARPRAAAPRRWRLPEAPAAVWLCLGWLVLVVAGGLLASWLAPHDPLAQDLRARNLPPFWMSGGSPAHLLGTDQIGHDLFSRLLFGTRPALTIAALAVAALAVAGSVAVGTGLGLAAGFLRGPVDTVVMLLVDAQLSTPFLVVAIAAVAALGRSLAILVLLAALSGWPAVARTIRAQVLSLRRTELVEASEAVGAGPLRILGRHLLPNVAGLVVVLAAVQVRGMILFEAAMSFLGLGVPPPNPSWGGMIDSGRDQLLGAWWVSLIPGLALMATVFAASLVGDWLGDVLDPTRRRPVRRRR